MPGRFVPLGTDGFGRSDTREALRRHFETDAAHVVVAVARTPSPSTGEVKAEDGRRRHQPLRHRARRAQPRRRLTPSRFLPVALIVSGFETIPTQATEGPSGRR